MDALTLLAKTPKGDPEPVYALTGDEDFLKRQVASALRRFVLGDGDAAEFAYSAYKGDEVDWGKVRNELATLPFLSDRRLVVVEQADPFVTACRAQLEKYVAAPSPTGVLVLSVKAWPKTTKLAKALGEAATISCETPAGKKLTDWVADWSKSRHGKAFEPQAAQMLVALVGESMGQLDQEIAKVAVAVGDAPAVKPEDVDRLVGRSRGAETFKIFDAVAAGKPADALAILARLLEQGEEPLKILGAFSWQLRPVARVGRLVSQKVPLAAAMDEAGIKPWQRPITQAFVTHLGIRRLVKLYDWLIETDLGLKGGSTLPERTQLERLLVRLARPRAG